MTASIGSFKFAAVQSAPGSNSRSPSGWMFTMSFPLPRCVVLLQPRATLGPLGRAPFLEERAQFRQRETSVGDDRKIDRLELADVLRPLARAQLHKPDLDDRAAGADAALLFVRRSVQT